MKFINRIFLGSLVMFGASSALADFSAELKVVGKIGPVACEPSFSDGGQVDFGYIGHAQLNTTSHTQLADKTFSYTITCNAPIALARSWSDGRGDSVVKIPEVSDATFGFGKHGVKGDKNIGSYRLSHIRSQLKGDGNPTFLLWNQGGWQGDTWVSNNNMVIYPGKGAHSTGIYDTQVPKAYTVHSGTIAVTPYIAPTKDLDFTDTIYLDGQAIMTVHYM